MTRAQSGDARELVGRQLGVYQIEALLDIGGQTGLFQARDLYTDQHVALKLLPTSLSTSRDAVTRLRDELRRVARLRHPHLLPVVEVGVEREILYAIALPPVASLRDYFERGGLLPPQDAVRYAAELAWALHALHSAGLVHGDVQPENMLFDAQSVLRLADFGVPRALQRQQGRERPPASPSRPLAGRSYVAPEVAQGGEITPRSDIYSLGAVFYEMLIGTLPLVAPNGTPGGEDITTAPLPPSMRSSEDWPELAAVALKALAPDPARRYADARAFAVALRTAVFTQQREDQRPSLVAALSGVFHAPAEGAEATFIQRITGAPVPSAPMPDMPDMPSTGPLDARHLAYRASPPSMPVFATPPAEPTPVNEDEIATTLLDERHAPRDTARTAWSEDDEATTLLDRGKRAHDLDPDLDLAVEYDTSPPPVGMPLPPPSIPPRPELPAAANGDDIDLTVAWLAALGGGAGEASAAAADAPDAADYAPPGRNEELVNDLRRLAGAPSRPASRRRGGANPGWLKALLATLGITVLAAVSAVGILASTHAPNAAPGGPAIPTATTAPANTVPATTPAATISATRPGGSHDSTYKFPTPTPIPPRPTATP